VFEGVKLRPARMFKVTICDLEKLLGIKNLQEDITNCDILFLNAE
jgi:hypothetical protein